MLGRRRPRPASSSVAAMAGAADAPLEVDGPGSYRVIVSNETPQLEEFSLCILQQNNCFQSCAPIH